MITFIELWSPNENWKNLSKEERGDYLSKMKPSIPKFLEQGASIIAWGHNDKINDHRGDHDYYAIWTFPDENLVQQFKELLQQANWYHFFDQINICGEGGSPDPIIGHMIQV